LRNIASNSNLLGFENLEGLVLGLFAPINENGFSSSNTHKYLQWGKYNEYRVSGNTHNYVFQKTNPHHYYHDYKYDNIVQYL
jgi:hypothetical protein